MANKTWQQGPYTLIKKLVKLYPVISVGAAGAVTLKKRQFTAAGTTNVGPSSSLVSAPTTGVGYVVGDGAGTRSVELGTAGLWTITLSDAYLYLVGVSIVKTKNATGVPLASSVGVKTDSVTTNTAVGNGGSLVIQLVDYAGVAVDPASGDVLTLEISLGDASEP